MFVPKEIVQNQLMRVGPIRRWAQGRHNTGRQQNPTWGRRVFDQLSGLAGRDLAGASVLELGPGRGTALMALAAPEVGSYAAFDVEPYLDAVELQEWGVDYRVDTRGSLPWDDATFDVVWSHSVLEHVRDPGQVLDEVKRVLRPDGVQLALIDLQDHYGDRRTPSSMYGFLRYSERLWWAMTSNRSSYCNRLRASDWRRVVAAHGFEIISEETTEATGVSVAEFREVAYLADVPSDDLLACHISLVMRVAAPGGVPDLVE